MNFIVANARETFDPFAVVFKPGRGKPGDLDCDLFLPIDPVQIAHIN
jgi:hypothetical protein